MQITPLEEFDMNSLFWGSKYDNKVQKWWFFPFVKRSPNLLNWAPFALVFWFINSSFISYFTNTPKASLNFFMRVLVIGPSYLSRSSFLSTSLVFVWFASFPPSSRRFVLTSSTSSKSRGDKSKTLNVALTS